MSIENQKNTHSIYVWDPIVRLGHWLLVAAFVIAYLTEGDVMPLHSWTGYTVAAVVLVRIVWGFIGSKHARFKDFIYAPKAVFGYLSGLIKGKKQHFVGHNPAGGAMVIALLFSLLMTAYSGMAVYAIEEGAGPLAQVNEQPSNWSLISQAYASGDLHEGHGDESKHEAEEFWEEIHEFFANFTLLLVLVHIGGVIASSRAGKENLVKAMITGKKEIN